MQRYLYGLVFKANQHDHVFTFEGNYRPDTIRLRVEKPGLHFIDAIYLNDSQHSEVMGSVDCYDWSLELQQNLASKFEEDYGLTRMSDADKQAFCDKHGISPPETGRIYLPLLRKGDKLRFVGRFSVDVYGTLLGTYYE